MHLEVVYSGVLAGYSGDHYTPSQVLNVLKSWYCSMRDGLVYYLSDDDQCPAQSVTWNVVTCLR